MALLQARIDDRLIHGQVVVGCCGPLQARRLVLCDDAVAADPLRRRIYGAAVPPDIAVEFRGIGEGADYLRSLPPADLDRTLLVVGSSAAMLALVDAGAPIDTVTVGGLHHRAGAQERWPGFFLDDAEMGALRELRARGLRVLAQSIPGTGCLDLAEQLAAPGSKP